MKLTASNAAIANTVVTTSLTIGNNSVVDSLTIGNTTINSSAISIGNVSIAPADIITPTLILGGGTPFGGGLFGGIVDYQEFTANGTWYNPYANASVNSSLTGYEQVFVMAWGGGGGSSSNNSQTSGGGGGAFALGNWTLSTIPNTVTVTVGLGGTASRTTTTALSSASAGGNTSFNGLVAYGGGGASTTSGGGGGILSAGTTVGGSPLGGAAGSGSTGGTSTFGGGGGGTTSGDDGGPSIFGGGGGGRGSGRADGGASVYGGGGGAFLSTSASVFGGNGGTSGDGVAPGGGGGSTTSSAGVGARGEVRVWVIGPGSTTAGAPTYTLTANTTTLYEGSSVLYTVSTTNVANNTTLYYTLNNSSTATSADFTTAVNGSVIINGGTGTFTLTAAIDADSANQAFQMDIRTGSTTGSIVASNGSVNIVPPSETLTYITSATSSDNLTSTTFTFQNISLGTAFSNRRIIVCYQGQETGGSHDITSVTIGDVPATLLAEGNQAGGGTSASSRAEIWIADVPTGTSANIVLTNSGATDWAKSIFVYSLDSNKTSIGVSATDTSSSYTFTRTFVEGEFYIGVGRCLSSTTETWTNATEDAVQTISGRSRASTASYGPATNGSRTITFDPNDNTSAYLLSVVLG